MHGTSPRGWAHALALTANTAGAVYTYLQCVFGDPGRVPPGYAPDAEACGPLAEVKRKGGGARFCGKCRAHKPPRAHHCRTCRRCVTRMDHHCKRVGRRGEGGGGCGGSGGSGAPAACSDRAGPGRSQKKKTTARYTNNCVGAGNLPSGRKVVLT